MKLREPRFTLKNGVQHLSEGVYKLHRPLHEYVPKNSKICVRYCRFYAYKGSQYPRVVNLDEFHPDSILENCAFHVGSSLYKEYLAVKVSEELESIKAQLSPEENAKEDSLAEAWKVNMNGY